MKKHNLKMMVCILALLGALPLSAVAGEPPFKVLGSLFVKETELGLSKQLPALMIADQVNFEIARGLEKAAAVSTLNRNSVEAFTREQIWPDEAEARFVLSAYLRNDVKQWKKADPRSEHYVFAALRISPEKYIYKRMLDEKMLYKPEIDAAFNTFSLVYRSYHAHTVNTAAVELQMKEFINTKVISKSLRSYLEADLKNGDIGAFLTDISDYYGIESLNETEAAISFLQRHPHGRTLALKRALHSPFTPTETRNHLRVLLQKSKLTPTETKELHHQLSNLFTAQNMLYKTVKDSAPIAEQKQMLTLFANKLDKFLAQHHRMPVWNAPSAEERNLLTEFEAIRRSRKEDNFGTLQVYYEQIEQVLKKHGLEG